MGELRPGRPPKRRTNPIPDEASHPNTTLHAFHFRHFRSPEGNPENTTPQVLGSVECCILRGLDSLRIKYLDHIISFISLFLYIWVWFS